MHMVDWNLDADGFVSGHDNTPHSNVGKAT